MRVLALVIAFHIGCSNLIAQTGEVNILENSNIDGTDKWIKVGAKADPENNFDLNNHVTYDATVSHTNDGSGSLKIGGLDCVSKRPWMAWRYRANIPVEAGAKYKISVWVKAQDLPKEGNAYIAFGFKDNTNQWLTNWVPGFPELKALNARTSTMKDNERGTHDWLELSADFTVPPAGVCIAYFSLRLDGILKAQESFVWFDDVTITKVE